jgi:invasin D
MIIQRSMPTPIQMIEIDVAGDSPKPEISAATQSVANPTESLERSVKKLNRYFDRALACSLDLTRMMKGPFAEGLEKKTLAEFAELTRTQHIRSQMWMSQLCQCFSVMTYSTQTAPLNDIQVKQLNDKQSETLRALRTENRPREVADGFSAGINSSNDFFEKLLELIDLIKNGYLAGYEHIIAAYSDFFADFNAEITAQMKDWIQGGEDGKNVTLDAGALRTALTNLINKYTHPNPASVLFPKPGDGGASKEEAENWLKALGLPSSCLKQNADGTWCVVIDTGPLTTMINSLPAGGAVTMDTAKFNAWQTGFNAQEERLKNMLQSLTQKYSNANSYHDNFNKTLSAHLNQFADMLKAMLNF